MLYTIFKGVAQANMSGIKYLYIETVEGWQMHKAKTEQNIKLPNTASALY